MRTLAFKPGINGDMHPLHVDLFRCVGIPLVVLMEILLAIKVYLLALSRSPDLRLSKDSS